MDAPLPSSVIKMAKFTFVVVGGGIAGVTCTEALSALDDECSILLISASPLIKAVTNFQQISKIIESFDVEEKPLCDLAASCPNVTVKHSKVSSFCPVDKTITTASGEVFHYEKLCICTGAKPKMIAKDNPYVIGIRDTETVHEFQERLKNTRRVIIVGNGGIATEIVYELDGCEVVWAIKDDNITSTFIDPGAATFFLPELTKEKEPQESLLKRRKYTHDSRSDIPLEGSTNRTLGSALGPDWSTDLAIKGTSNRTVQIEYNVNVKRILTPQEVSTGGIKVNQLAQSTSEDHDWPVYVELSNNKVYGCDFIISATGVTPNSEPFSNCAKFAISPEGGLNVNDRMQTTIEDVFAAGDVCSATWEFAPHWMQMRLWTQARQLGAYAARCMVAAINDKLDDVMLDFCFELFAHVTKFFNYKVVLLGQFNAQTLGTDHHIILRVTKGCEYVKAVMSGGRMHGALLIGDTGLEETLENLILNQLDLSVHGEHLLDANIDIEDYFD